MRLAVLAAGLALVSVPAVAAECSRPAPVQFPPGQSSMTIAGGSPDETSNCYQVTAQADQNLILKLEAANRDTVFAVYAPGWSANCNADGDCTLDGDLMSEDNTTEWAETLQASGAYLIVVDNSHSASDYRLTVEIED